MTVKGMSYRRLMDDLLAAMSLDQGRLAYIDVEDFTIEIWKQLLYHKDKWVSPQMESVITYCIQREFGEDEGRK